MSLVKGRAGVGGRKPVEIPNPFVCTGTVNDTYNLLWEENPKVAINVVDLITGIIRAFGAESEASKKQEYVNWVKVQRLYKGMQWFTRQEVQDCLRCSPSTAKRYIQVLKLCNLFISMSPYWKEVINEFKEFSLSSKGDAATGS